MIDLSQTSRDPHGFASSGVFFFFSPHYGNETKQLLSIYDNCAGHCPRSGPEQMLEAALKSDKSEKECVPRIKKKKKKKMDQSVGVCVCV